MAVLRVWGTSAKRRRIWQMHVPPQGRAGLKYGSRETAILPGCAPVSPSKRTRTHDDVVGADCRLADRFRLCDRRVLRAHAADARGSPAEQYWCRSATCGVGRT